MNTHFHSFSKVLLLIIFLQLPGITKFVSAQEYFQQEVNYTIHVTLNDRSQQLNAFQSVEYINNSADTLPFIYFHLWPNAYANNQTALAKQLLRLRGKQKLFKQAGLSGNIDSLNFQTSGKKLHWQLLTDTIDICKVFLAEPLRPGDSVIITTPFRVKIPKGISSRLGYIGESYQISQWFPKPAVYDNLGWHPMPYLDQGEFYSEFGKFDVHITLPENYIVGASGELMDASEISFLDQLASDSSWHGVRYKSQSFPPSSEKLKTLHYRGNQIHDFAWFADKRFNITKSIIQLKASGREVTILGLFTNQQSNHWKSANKFASRAILHLSEWIGDYPYNTFTVVQSALTAGAGMEYPGLAVIGQVEDAYSLDEVISHEAAHNWFYSAIASNERMYPFMDESISSAYELRYMDIYYPDKKLWEVYFTNPKLARFFNVDRMPLQRMSELSWLKAARNNLEQPINLKATDYSDENYGTMVYNKGALGFNYLRAWLGDSLFDATMQQYYNQWKFKHPQPDDLRDIFEQSTTKDLNWFFEDFLGTTKRLDYKLLRLKDNQLLVKNKGKLESPLHLAGMMRDSLIFEQWVEGFSGNRWISLPDSIVTEVILDPMHRTSEIFRLNNNIRSTGIFPKADPIKTQFYFTLEDPAKRTLMYLPVINWNRENGFMLGLALHNGFILPKTVEYFLMPFFSFKNKDIAGYGKVSLRFIPFESFIRIGIVSLDGARFAAIGNQNYHKAKLGLNLYFRNGNFNSPFNQQAFGNYIIASDLDMIRNLEKTKMRSFGQLGYRLEKASLINPLSLVSTYEFSSAFQKVSFDLKYRISYYGKNSGLNMRLFAGKVLKNNSGILFYNIAAGGRNGREQYLYEGTFPDRFSEFPDTFWSRQMTLAEGGLVSYLNDSLGYSDWVVSINFDSNLPVFEGKLPVKPFLNLMLNEQGSGSDRRPVLMMEAGLKAGFWNLFEVYFPFFISENLKRNNGAFKDRIRFVLSIDAIQKL
ncbi:MAG: M1 family metallopeptidase [Bacteroidales bacterium]|nr:M1 family metallopeptidase [Bacteroidales bacterium]